ncbi:MAG: hypothetical protein ACKO6B_11750 [Planctomycetia bacterium]
MSRYMCFTRGLIPTMKRRRCAAWAALVGSCAVAGLAGCGSRDDRYPVAGSVTHAGRPVPRGAVWFEPTVEARLMAAPGFALIENGSYRTPAGTSPGKGPYRVRIIGRDGTPPTEKDLAEMMPGQKFLGQPVFPEYKTSVELTGTNGRLDFDVPSQPAQ